MKPRLIVLFIVLAVLSSFLLASARTDSPREWAPVQKGFVQGGEKVLPYAPDRVMVKFTEPAMENLKLDIEFEMDTASPLGNVRTGIVSVDAISRQLGVTKVSRPYIELKNKAEEVRLGIDRWYRFDLPSGSRVMEAVDQLSRDPNVEYAKPDWVAFPAVVPSDPLYADHWGHNNTAQLPGYDWGGTWDHTGPPVGTPGFDANAQNAWDVTYGSSSVIIAILDSGVDLDHPDLTLVAGYDFGDNDSNPDDNSAAAGHGTCCAGVAAADVNNGRGACGSAPGARIMPIKVANSAGSMYFSSIENGLYWAADNGADVISMSLGAYVSSDPATDAAIEYAYNAGCVILAATSNDNDNIISYPANHAYVIGVGAASPCGDRKRSSSLSSECNPGVNPDPNGYTCDGERWWGSNYGSTIPDAAGAVDILGPTILPTSDIAGSGGYQPGDYEPFFNGTSCATPYVAGVCALIITQNPGWTPAQVRNQLVTTAIDIVNVESGSGWDRYSGYGMVDAEAAVGGGGPTPPTAAFSGTPTSGDAPLTVTFTDMSSGDPTSWSWNFGDTGTSGVQNPVHTYDNPGTYTVTLTVSNAYGSDDEVKTNYITVTEPGSGYATLPYSTGFETGSLDPYWTTNSTGDGRVQITTSNTPHSGSWHMTMDDPTSGGYTQNEAWLHLNLAGEGDVELDFWWKDFSDENHSQDGVYFSDNGGSSFVKVQDLYGQSYSNNTWYNFTLDVDALASANGLSLTSQFVIKFQQYDNYPIATDGHAWDDISVTSAAPPPPPVAAFSGSPTSGEAPLQVQFTDESTGNPTSWSWNFGDGVGTSTAQNPAYTYDNPGTYTVTLTATNAGGSDDEVKTDYITVTPPSGGGTVGEVDVVVRNQTGNGADWYTVNTTNTYTNAVVVMKALSTNGGHKTHLRVRNVGASSFQWQMEEWDYHDGNHTTEDCPYIVMEAGVHSLDGGAAAEAGNASVGTAWQTISFNASFSGTPMLLVGVASQNDGAAVVARTRNLTSSSFQVKLQEEEAADGVHANETVAWIAIEQGTGTNNGSNFDAGRTGNVVTDANYNIGLTGFSIAPIFLCHDDTYDGGNTCSARFRTVTSTTATVFIEEEQSADSELGHVDEVVSYLAWAAAGDITAAGGARSAGAGFDDGDISGAPAADSPRNFEYGMGQNYPNPFNPRTTIAFTLAGETDVTLEVFNVAGQRVATLVDGRKGVGRHVVDFDASSLSSGVYFYRLVAGEFTEMRKMVLLK